VQPRLGELPRSLAAGHAGADDGDVRVHGPDYGTILRDGG
jgi:hypothetical protein